MEKSKEAKISFYAAECMEFIDYGVCIEAPHIAQAVAAYRRICKKNTSYGRGIGFVLQDNRISEYSGIHWPLYQSGKIAKDDIDLIPAYRDHPLVQQAVREIEPYLPELANIEKVKKGRER